MLNYFAYTSLIDTCAEGMTATQAVCLGKGCKRSKVEKGDLELGTQSIDRSAVFKDLP